MEYIDTSKILFDLKIDCNWHSQLQGEVPNECMKIQVTAASSQVDPVVELYALNSQSIPLEDHEGSWSQLIPTWRFVDEYENAVTRIPIHTKQHPIYTDIVTGEAKVKYIDDSPSEIGRPILLLATMNLTGYPLEKENIYTDKSDAVITHPGYSNSKITKVHVMEINESTPNGLRISRNGIEPMSAQTYWAGQFIPCVVTVEGWKPKAYNNGDVNDKDKHITIYNYPYNPDIAIPLTGFIYAQETGIPEYDIETSGIIYGGSFRRYTDDENKFRTGGYAIISAVPEFESDYTVISACARPENHTSRPWTMAKSWIAFPDTDSPSTVAYFYPFIDEEILNSEIARLVNNPESLFGVDSIPYSFSVPIKNSIADVVPGADAAQENKNTGGTGVFAMDLSCNTWIPDCELGTLTKINRNHEIIGKRIYLMEDVNSVADNISLTTPFEAHLSPNNLWLSVDDKIVTTCFTDHIITVHDAITHEILGCAYTPPTQSTDLYPEVNGKPMDSQGRPVAAIIGYHGTHHQEDQTKETKNPIFVFYESFFKGYGQDREEFSLVQFDYSNLGESYESAGPGYNIYSTGLSATSVFDFTELNGQNILDVTYYNEYVYVLSEDYTGTGNANFNNKGHLTVIPLMDGVGEIKVFSLLSDGKNILHPASICIGDTNPETATPSSPVSIYFTGYTEHNEKVNAGVFKIDNFSYTDQTAGDLIVDRLNLKTLEIDNEHGNLGRYTENIQSYTNALNGLSIDSANQIWLVDNRVGKLKVFYDLAKEPSEISFPIINGTPVNGTAHGDWNGSRLMLNYFHWEFAPHTFYGESEPFIVDSYTNYKIRKHNDSWHIVDRMKYATDVAPFKENTNFFERYIGAAFGGERVHGSYSIARKLYERIANSVANIHDVDECGMDELHSIGVSQDVPMDMFTPHYPEELKRLMDLFSVSHEKLWGDRCKCDSFYFESPGQYNLKNIPEGEENDYNPKRFCPVCKHYHGTNLGPMISNTDEIKLDVDEHPPYVVRSRYNKHYIKIVPSIQSIRDAHDLLHRLEHMTGDDSRKTPQYNAMVQLLIRINTEKESRHNGEYEKCPIWSSFLYNYGPVQTSSTDVPENCITSAFNEYYNQLEEIEPLSESYLPVIDQQLIYIYKGEGSTMKEMGNLREWISMFQQPVTPTFNITAMPQSITKDLLILKFTIDNLSTEHDKLVAVHTSMFTPEPWYNYCIYHYIPTQCGNLNTSVINWDDSMNSLSESVSGLNDWYRNGGIVENMLSYVMRKGLGFESANIGKYMIYFYSNTGFGQMEVQTIPRNIEQPLSKCTFTKFGYKFIGWSTSPFGKVIYQDEQMIKNLLEAHEVIALYAQWEKLPCLTVTFEPNGAEGLPYTQEIPMFTSAELLPYTFNAPGSGFGGWATKPNGEVVLDDLQVVYNTSDVDVTSTLYAHWFTLTDREYDINNFMSYINS